MYNEIELCYNSRIGVVNMSKDVVALDLETEATNPKMQLHGGLEPWRLRQGNARITSMAVCMPDDSVIQIENNGASFKADVIEVLHSLRGMSVFAHNALFDIAWLIVLLEKSRVSRVHEAIDAIRWRDTGLLCKWLINGQLADKTHFRFNLVNLIQTFLKDHPLLEEFVTLKNQKVMPGTNPEYWLRRGEMDVIMTRALALFFMSKLPVEQRVGVLTEFACLVPTARSWVMGIRIDQDKLKGLNPKYEKIRVDNAKALGISTDVFTSTKQLPDLLFRKWGLPIIARTPTGNPSCAGDTLLWLKYKLLNEGNEEMANRLDLILKAKEASTLQSKYVKSMYAALEHTGDGHIYGAPRIFGTYTGRFTYSSTVKSKDDDDVGHQFKVSIALHQIPRKAKDVRATLLPPKGFKVYEADASGQESRLMAIRSQDPVMLNIFSRNMNFHSMTGASIIGLDYTEFEEKRDLEHGVGYHTEQRQLGKLTNLSCNYRIGGKALSEKAFIDYDTYMTIDTGRFLVNTFNRTYAGVPKYWEDVVWDSRQSGYTEAFGGRRYKLTLWSTDRWMTESSAINVPIQGAGASMKEIAIAETYQKVPDAFFALDLHDASFFWVPEDRVKEVSAQLDHVLNNIDYAPYWGFTPAIPLPYESNYGNSIADVK